MFLAVIIGIPTMLFLRYIEFILIFFGQNPVLSGLVQNFYSANSWGVIPGLCNACLMQFLINIGKQRLSLFLNILYVLLSIFGEYAFILGHFGAPNLGITGIGYAIPIASCMSLSFNLIKIFFNPIYKQYKLFVFSQKVMI